MEINTADQKFEKNLSTCFFRICQESLTNISKHAEATKISITVEQTQNQLQMIISDNGKGISNDRITNPFSMGLIGMRERAKNVGALLKITSASDSGTTIRLDAKLV
jgi:signal transduction histidine kinase